MWISLKWSGEKKVKSNTLPQMMKVYLDMCMRSTTGTSDLCVEMEVKKSITEWKEKNHECSK